MRRLSIAHGTFALAVGLFASGLCWPAWSVPILVANPSFEILPASGLPAGCGAGCSYSVNTPIPFWTSGGSSFGQFQPGVQVSNFTYFNSVPDGITVAYINGGTIAQTVGATAQAGVTYTLQGDLGFRKDTPDPGTITLEIGSHSILATGVAAPLSGNWVDYTATYTALATDAGDSISILLSSNAAQGDFDNVRLSNNLAAGIPEPATVAIFGVGLIGLGAMLRRRKAKAGWTSAEGPDKKPAGSGKPTG
jgi:hypothetical protein